MPPLDLDAEQELANTLQSMLQSFRLSHYAKVAASHDPCFLKFPQAFATVHVPLRLECLARETGATTWPAHWKQSIQFDRFNELEWVVMLALLVYTTMQNAASSSKEYQIRSTGFFTRTERDSRIPPEWLNTS